MTVEVAALDDLVPSWTAETSGRRSRRGLILRRASALALLAPIVLACAVPGLLASQDPQTLDFGALLQPPSGAHWFGTDESGRDLFSRVVYGARRSVLTAVAIIAIASTVGTVLGLTAGYFGGKWDFLVGRVVELFMSFPYFLLALVIAISLGRGTATVIIALAAVWWPSFTRMVRGITMSVAQAPFVEAARTLGTSHTVIIFRHVLPQMRRELTVRMSLDVGYALVAATGLSFLGLGVSEPASEWGLLVTASREYVDQSWWYPTFPGLAIFVTALALGLLADAFEQRADR